MKNGGKLFAAIDVGSFNTELVIYDISKKNGIREVDHLRVQLPIGHDTYNDGMVSNAMTEEICGVLRRFSEVMKGYHVDDYAAYASSALREARNGLIVLDQIRIRTGLQLITASNSEYRYMSYKAVAGHKEDFNRALAQEMAILDVGFGSSQLSMFEKGNLTFTQNLSLGVLRISESAVKWDVDAKEVPEVIEELMNNELGSVADIYLRSTRVKTLIITGETINYLVLRGHSGFQNKQFSADEFARMCRKVSKMSVTDLQDAYNVSRNAARVMVPSAILFARVVEMTGAQTVWTPGTVACDGFAADYAQEQGLIKFDHDFEEDIISSARDLADHYCCHREHVQAVEVFSGQIFDATRKYHGLDPHCRLLLRIAAILHDCGKYVSITRGSMNAYEIIMSSELIGLSHLDREIVANVVLYNIQEFDYDDVSLGTDLSLYTEKNYTRRELKIVIAKLAAMLRLANSIDRSHRQKLKGAKIDVRNDRLAITTGYDGNLTLEKYSVERKADFFEEMIGIRPVIRRKRKW